MSATLEQRGELWTRAMRLRYTAPRCGECGTTMRLDSFNGMFFCQERGHGGYQTQDQVVRLHYNEMLEELEPTQ